MFKSKQKALSGNSEQVNPLLTTHIVYVNSTPKRGVRQWITTILTGLGSRAKRRQTSRIGSIRSVMLMQPPHARSSRTYVTKSGVLNATERS